MKINDYNWSEIFLKAENLLYECGVEGGVVDRNAKLVKGNKPVCHVKILARGNLEAIKKLLSHDNVTYLYSYNASGNRYKKFSVSFDLEEVMGEVKDDEKPKKAESELNELAEFLDIAIKMECEVRLSPERVKQIRELVKKEQTRQVKYDYGCYFCSVCGNEVGVDDEYCSYCGQHFSEEV